MKTPIIQNKLDKLKEEFSLSVEELVKNISKGTDNAVCDFWLLPHADFKNEGFDITDYLMPTVESYNVNSRYKCYHVYLIQLVADKGEPYLLLHGQCDDEQGVENRNFTLIELNFENRLLAVRLLEESWNNL
jgi:hypothetical protein